MTDWFLGLSNDLYKAHWNCCGYENYHCIQDIRCTEREISYYDHKNKRDFMLSHPITWKPVNSFSSNFILELPAQQICWIMSNFIRTGTIKGVLYIKTNWKPRGSNRRNVPEPLFCAWISYIVHFIVRISKYTFKKILTSQNYVK
jgi:hypothetical protein